MKVSIRESDCNGMARLLAYRPRERAYALPGSAYETKSGRWIVHLPGQPADVVDDKAAAAAALQTYYAAQE
jgi:hypothetical protein